MKPALACAGVMIAFLLIAITAGGVYWVNAERKQEMSKEEYRTRALREHQQAEETRKAMIAQARAQDAAQKEEQIKQLEDELYKKNVELRRLYDRLDQQAKEKGVFIPMEFADKMSFGDVTMLRWECPRISENTCRLLKLSAPKREAVNTLLQETWYALMHAEAKSVEVIKAEPDEFKVTIASNQPAGEKIRHEFEANMKNLLTAEQYLLWSRREGSSMDFTMLDWLAADITYEWKRNKGRKYHFSRTTEKLNGGGGSSTGSFHPRNAPILARFRRFMHPEMRKQFPPLPGFEGEEPEDGEAATPRTEIEEGVF